MKVHYAEAARNGRPWCGSKGWHQPLVTTDYAAVTCAQCRQYLRLDGEAAHPRRGPYKRRGVMDLTKDDTDG